MVDPYVHILAIPFNYPSAIKAVGYNSDHQRRAVWGGGGEAGGRAGGQSGIQLLLKSSLINFVYFYRHDLCAWAIHPIKFLGHQAISGHFPRWPPKKFMGAITYEPLVGLH